MPHLPLHQDRALNDNRGLRRKLPTGTVTFLFSDVEGSTRLLEQLGAERYAEALAEHRHALRDAIARHGGVEVDTQGDAFFAAFSTADGGLAAAQHAQRALAAGPIRVRIGLHTGEPVVTAEGYVGMDVHRGARIAAAGHGGQVLVSETTRLALTDGAELRDLGEQRLKDLGAPIRLYQLGDAEFPPLKVLYRATLPVQPSPLIGRERELAEAAALLEGARLLTFTGPGGSGKTRLALQVAAEHVDEFADGVFWVPLAAVTDPEIVMPTIAQAVGAADGVAEHVGAGRTLLVVDNFEQVLDAAPGLADVLGACPNLKLLVTSRAPLRVAGEQEYAVDPLPASDAVRLFAERARAVAPGFEPGPAAEEICRRLDGLPLAIELAAARLRVFDADQLLARLEQRLPLLTGGRRDAPERQRTLRAAIEWSHDLLDSEQQRLFARLAVFPGSFSLEAAEAVCGAPLDAVEALVEQSLVRRWGSGRLGMLETIRELAVERLRASGDYEELARTHLDWFLALAEQADASREALTPEGLARLDAERDNFRAALRYGLDDGEAELALRLAAALGRLWVVRSHQEGYAWLTEALEAAPGAPVDVHANGLMWAGSTLFFTGDYAAAQALVEQALALFRELGDDRQVATLLDRLSGLRLIQGDVAQGLALAEESIALYRALGEPDGARHPLEKVASVARRMGDLERAEALFEEALALSRRAGDAWSTASGLLELATLAAERDPERATTLAGEGLALAAEIENPTGIAHGLVQLSLVAAKDGEMERAGTLWGAAEAMAERGEALLDPGEHAHHEAALLAEPNTAFDAGREAGRAMPVAEAVAVALA